MTSTSWHQTIFTNGHHGSGLRTHN